MKVSAIQSPVDENHRRNLFISYSNSFMSSPEVENPQTKAVKVCPKPNTFKMGLENLEEFTIFPKETIEGKTVITA